MTPAEHGRLLAQSARPITDEQVEAAARIFAGIEQDVVAA